MDSQPKQKRVSPLTLVLIIIIILLAGAAVVLAVGKLGGDEETEQLGDDAVPKIGYEEGVTVVNDPDALQKAVNEAFEKARDSTVPVEYQNEAFSTDGQTVECYIANPVEATRDIYIGIYKDQEFTDQLYLSKLIPPGNAIREIVLDRPLDTGANVVYVVYTQVEDDHATIHGQVAVTMNFNVGESE